MPIQKRWTHWNNASPPSSAGIYEFGVQNRDNVVTIIYIGRAQGGSSTIKSRFRDHISGRGNQDVYYAVQQYSSRLYYRYEEVSSTMLRSAGNQACRKEAMNIQRFESKNHRLPAGNKRRETVDDGCVIC